MARALQEVAETNSDMFKISIIETHNRRRLVLEGRLVHPWTDEVERAWAIAGSRLEGRSLIIDLRNVTLISREGENTLLQMMKTGAKFSTGDVLTKHVLKELGRRCKSSEKVSQTCQFPQRSNDYIVEEEE